MAIIDDGIPILFDLDTFTKPDPGFRPIFGSIEITPGLKQSISTTTGIGVPFRGWWVDAYNVVRLLNKFSIYSYRNLIKALSACVFEEICHYFGFLHSTDPHFADLERTFIANLHGFHMHHIRGWEFNWLYSLIPSNNGKEEPI